MDTVISIIVPTYNEADSIPELMGRLTAALKGYEFIVIFVDDASPDGTAMIAEALGRTYGNVRGLRRPRRMGLASAVLDGMRLVESDIVAVMDADMQHPPELLPLMYEKVMEGNDIVIASRYLEGNVVGGWDLRRRVVSLVALKLAHILLPRARSIKDPISGYFMFDKRILLDVRLRPIGYKILLEILVNGRYDKIAEVPYVFKQRLRGRTKLGLKEIWNYMRQIRGLLMLKRT